MVASGSVGLSDGVSDTLLADKGSHLIGGPIIDKGTRQNGFVGGEITAGKCAVLEVHRHDDLFEGTATHAEDRLVQQSEHVGTQR